LIAVSPIVTRILLVDDNEPDNVFHEAVLRGAGFQGDLRAFEEPEAALEYLRQLPHGPVCLLLLDINMPGMNGWEFARAAEPLLEDNPTVILVMLTSSSLPEDRAQAESEAAVSGYLTKPLTVEVAVRLLSGNWSVPT